MHATQQLSVATRVAEEREHRLHELEWHLHNLHANTASQLSNARAHVHQLESRNAELERELAATRDGAQKTTALLETRTTELRAAQTFLTTADDVADSDVRRIVGSINARIFQTAATICDAFQDGYGTHQDGVEDAWAQLAVALSDDVVEALREASDSAFVQAALQAVMAAHIHRLCTTWDLRNGDHAGDVFAEVYNDIRQNEPQSVSGRWRALCRKHLCPPLAASDKRPHLAGSELAATLAAVLRAFGALDSLESMELHTDALNDIVRLAMDFRRLAGETVVSSDFALLLAPPGEVFDEEWLEDEWAEPSRRRKPVEKKRLVLCTTGLGLVREEGGGLQKRGDGGGSTSTVVVKVKVLVSPVPIPCQM
ncbi:uncharacterized protein BXZ73DRAFT_43214 [Epithele typhae]|uniref:uncharacterized protein n=1 Tax=Epithele typhae TaxID=378194 RepID=UPI00200721DB|nr:uncharacterized protein BXZ73DRAFT_43214 [Epithele typhae]KAH9940095.1 hypothetical protein BXZ73DRAFT_43214 [Epithele typhae]